MSPADRDEQTHWDERLARTDAGELYGVSDFKIFLERFLGIITTF